MQPCTGWGLPPSNVTIGETPFITGDLFTLNPTLRRIGIVSVALSLAPIYIGAGCR